MRVLLAFAIYLNLMVSNAEAQNQHKNIDVCVYGATSAGIIAGYSAAKLGKSVVIIEPGQHMGGLTTGGLGFTDIGNKYAITGISRDFYRRVGKYYGRFEQWIFEPGVASMILHQYIRDANLDIVYGQELDSVTKISNKIETLQFTSTTGGKSISVKAKVFIDASYEGDLMAKSGVSYTLGREPNSQYNETYNGVQLRDKHQFPDGISPYINPEDASSGLLWGISNAGLADQGSGDRKIQAYNFRICLTNNPANKIDITQPQDYNPDNYALLSRVIGKTNPANIHSLLKFDYMPNSKTDINNNGAFSTDMIGENYDYAEADFATRKAIITKHENYTKGLLYFLSTHNSVPENIRKEMLQWGYPKDEYVTTNNWSPQLYIREARRMIGAYVMTQDNCEGKRTVGDGIGMAAYTMDSHNCQRIVVDGMVKNEGDVQIGGFGPYPISYRSIIPKGVECTNLLVPVSLSASHIAFGSIRMEPVFMVLAQSAAVAASLAIDAKQSVQEVDVKAIQQILADNPLLDGSVADILIDSDDTGRVLVSGDWEQVKGRCYGPSKFSTNDVSTKKAVRFSASIKKTGVYTIYSYMSKENTAQHTAIHVFDGKSVRHLNVSKDAINVQGQTSGEWVVLGAFTLQEGSNPYVEITNDNANGTVEADAILLVFNP